MMIEKNSETGSVQKLKSLGVNQAHEAPTRLERLTMAAQDFETAVRKGEAIPPGGRMSYHKKASTITT